MKPIPTILLAGGSGFLGRALTREFLARGFTVIILTRTPHPRTDGAREVAWDGEHPGDWAAHLNGAAAVINLTGKSIDCPHTPENLLTILTSRVNSVHALAAALPQAPTPPRVWVQASAAGFYGDTSSLCTETAAAGTDPLANICQQWENAFTAAALPATRKVTLRIGFVLGRDGGALPVLRRLTDCFLGGAAGPGRQYISWIHLADLVQMFLLAVTDETLRGTYNAVAPAPVPNAEFMRALRHTRHRPWSPPAPAFAVKLGARLLRSDGCLALVSQRCLPQKFLAAGFPYQFPALPPALQDLCGK